uniref:Uncharacterized protein n=1 Tax=Rhizophora mucronata TaxID=61149 RepID=A0A2P2QMU4_RHIMU
MFDWCLVFVYSFTSFLRRGEFCLCKIICLNL